MKTISQKILTRYIEEPDPVMRYFALGNLLPGYENEAAYLTARDDLFNAKLIRTLSNPPADLHPYQKWQGAHWCLVLLADLGYPFLNPEFVPMRDKVYSWLFSEQHQKSIRTLNDRIRRCASQEGNSIYASVKLNLANDQTERLVDELLAWQWPDGGWNCDKRPEASHSSFWETWSPSRALLTWREYASGNPQVDTAIGAACEVFLSHQLFISATTGKAMQAEFLRLHHPAYWKYDILVGLELMQQAGKLSDPRCNQALDLLENKMLPEGGFPLEERFFQTSNPQGWHYSPVDWGNTSHKRENFWVTVRALKVLISAGRINY